MREPSTDTRGQVTSPWPAGALTMLVVFTLGIVVAETIIGDVTSVDMASIETTCLGIWGCGSPSLFGVVGTIGLLLVVGGVVVMGLRGWLPRP